MEIRSPKQPALAHGASKAYQLLFPDHQGNTIKTVNFKSHNGSEAFIFAEREPPGQAGQLRCNGRLLCSLVCDEDGVWTISPASAGRTTNTRFRPSMAGGLQERVPSAEFLERCPAIISI